VVPKRIASTTTGHVGVVKFVQTWSIGARPDRYSIGNTQLGSSARKTSSIRTTRIAALVELNSPALIEEFIPRSLSPPTMDRKTTPCSRPQSQSETMIAALMEARMANRPSEYAELLLALGLTDPTPSFWLVAEGALEFQVARQRSQIMRSSGAKSLTKLPKSKASLRHSSETCSRR
jgi:hypothetical protein